MLADNAVVVEAWNTVLFDKFSRFKHLLVDGLSAHSDAFLEHHQYPQGSQVLDVGCGFGDSALRIARQVGSAGAVVGVDCAENFVRAAQQAAREEAAENVSFVAADVQVDPLGGPYDHVFARFGTMFFNMPGAAMRNISRSLKPGGSFAQIVWRQREDNPWLHEAELAVKELVPVVSHEETDQVHCGPGPFSMAGPDMVSAMLVAAGFERITFERCDADICIGKDLDEAVDFAMSLGPAGEIMRLAGEKADEHRAEVDEALRRTLGAFERGGEIWGPSSTWIITCRKRG